MRVVNIQVTGGLLLATPLEGRQIVVNVPMKRSYVALGSPKLQTFTYVSRIFVP